MAPSKTLHAAWMFVAPQLARVDPLIKRAIRKYPIPMRAAATCAELVFVAYQVVSLFSAEVVLLRFNVPP